MQLFILDFESMIYVDPVPVDLCFFQDRIPRQNYNPYNSFLDILCQKLWQSSSKTRRDAESESLSFVSHDPLDLLPLVVAIGTGLLSDPV